MSQIKYSVAERLMRYVQIDTQSDPFSTTFPSTEKQKDLSRLLVQELQELGVKDVELDENGYVYATIPSNLDYATPTVFFCAHVDTSPDCSGTNVKPILHKNWNGDDIVLPDDPTVVISKNKHTYLAERIGDDIITASGKTLLGADDKAGVAIIMNVAEHIMAHPDIPHGDIKILFTPDEEVGQGVDKINLDKFKADFGYTLDGGERGHLEGENFYADAGKVIFYGVSAHPGYAKGKLVNAVKIAADFIERLPKDALSPETSEGYEGFVHPVHIEGIAEKVEIKFIMREFDYDKLKANEEYLKKLAEATAQDYPGVKCEVSFTEQYRNMKEILDQYPMAMEIADKAFQACDMPTKKVNIRGGTDGARLSFMGLPCPNIFTGEMGIHSKEEYCSVQDMQKATDVCIKIIELTKDIKK